MPLMIEGGRIPPRWVREGNHSPSFPASPEHLSVALINNMPDAALEDTELQFFRLLDEASGELPIFVKLYSLSGVPRTDPGLRHLNSYYRGLDELWDEHLDGVIITGTEPHHADLRDEPYWRALTRVFDWAERNTSSAILSCLAAHASVLHSDGIPRHRLPDKKFGVYDFTRAPGHRMTDGTGARVRFPHSRWNEVRADELLDCGYTILTQSSEGGVDTFTKKKQKSLFLHFQGHPEYSAETLMKEYRRDIRRFIRNERETYPTKPHGYFDGLNEVLVQDFRESVLGREASERSEELMADFPDAVLLRTLQRTWSLSASTIYRNWLGYMVAIKTELSRFAARSSVQRSLRHKTALPK